MHINEELFKSEEFKKNLKLYEDSMKSGEAVFMDIDDMTDIIDYYNYDGNVDDAERVANYALSLYPGAIGPLVFKARRAMSDDDFDEAVRYCEAIEDKTDLDYFFLKVEIQIATNNCDEAEEMLEDELPDVDPQEKESFLLDAGALYVDYEIPELAEKWLSRISNKDNIERLELIARLRIDAGEYEEAMQVLERLIDNNPFICRYWNLLALIQLYCNQYNESLNSAEYSLAITPDNTDGLWFKAKALIANGDIEGAIAYYDRFLERVPNCARVEAEKGSCYLCICELDKALESLKLAESHCGDDDMALLGQIYDDLAFTYSGIRDVDKALYYLNKAEGLPNFHEDIQGVDSQRMVLKAHILMQNGQKEKAIGLFDKAIENSKYNPEIILKAIVSVYDLALYDLTIKYCSLLEKVMPIGWTAGFSYMAASLLKTERLKEGLEYLKKASRINPNEVETVFRDMFPPNITKEQFFEYLKHVDLG